jgi:hypothetical protein
VNSSSVIWKAQFREAYCRRYGCPVERFEVLVLRQSFPVWVRVPGSILLAIRPQWFRRELALIGRLGEARHESQVKQELEGYAYENARDKHFRTETLGLRLSRRRFIQLMRRVMAWARAQGDGDVAGEESRVEGDQ